MGLESQGPGPHGLKLGEPQPEECPPPSHPRASTDLEQPDDQKLQPLGRQHPQPKPLPRPIPVSFRLQVHGCPGSLHTDHPSTVVHRHDPSTHGGQRSVEAGSSMPAYQYLIQEQLHFQIYSCSKNIFTLVIKCPPPPLLWGLWVLYQEVYHWHGQRGGVYGASLRQRVMTVQVSDRCNKDV